MTKFLDLNLHVGQSKSGLLCHVCGGGRTGEKTLSVTRNQNGFVWKCHRATCGSSGIKLCVAGEGGNTLQRHHQNGKRSRHFHGSLLPLSGPARDFISVRWCLEEWHVEKAGVALMEGYPKGTSSAFNGRMWVPVRGYNGTSYGGVARALDTTDGLGKTIGYYDADTSYNLSYGPTGPHNIGGPVVLVEDQISSLRASRYVLGVSLLGTSLTHGKIAKVVADTGARVLNLCLDRDAVALAVEYAKKFSSLCRIVVHPMSRDLKDLDEKELQEYLLNMEK